MVCCWQGCWKSFNSGEKLSPVGEDNGGGGVCVCSMCACVHVVCVSSHAWQHQDVWYVVCVCACVHVCMCASCMRVCVFPCLAAPKRMMWSCSRLWTCLLLQYSPPACTCLHGILDLKRELPQCHCVFCLINASQDTTVFAQQVAQLPPSGPKPFYSGHSVPKDTIIILWWTAFKVQGVCVCVCACVCVCVCVCVCMVHSAQILSRIHNVPTCTLIQPCAFPSTYTHTYVYIVSWHWFMQLFFLLPAHQLFALTNTHKLIHYLRIHTTGCVFL